MARALQVLTAEPADGQQLFCERFVEFMIDLMSQAPTRRYTHALLEDKAVLIKCRMAPLFQEAQLFRQLVDLFQFYMTFPIRQALAKCHATLWATAPPPPPPPPVFSK